MEERNKYYARLLKAARQGDSFALNELCRNLQDVLIGYFRVKFNSDETVRDLSQETYIRFLENLNQINEPMKLERFVIKIAFHVSQNYLRSRYRSDEKISTSTEEGEYLISAYQEQESRSDDPYDEVMKDIDVHRALGNLKKKSRDVLQLYMKGYRSREIADQLGMTESAVKMQLKRSAIKVQKSLIKM